MLQDLREGRLENEYMNIVEHSYDRVICFSEGQVLVKRNANDTLELPTVETVKKWAIDNRWNRWNEKAFQYAFSMEGEKFFLWMGSAGIAGEGFSFEVVKSLRQIVSKEICYAIMTGWHLYIWYRDNRFCGRCGGVTYHHEKERAICCDCGNLIFPKICPAVIVAVTDGDRILLSQYAGRDYRHYALLAGYTEIGETLEQTVHREVLEEVGLCVKNIRYYKSQPWGVDGNVLMGFFCDLDGTDVIKLDQDELATAAFFHRHELPVKDDGISLTREMIRIFAEGKEPK